MDLQYWNNGIPVLPVDDSSMRELKYWGNGIPYVMLDSGAAPPVGTNIQINIGDSFKSVDAMKINVADSWKEVVAVKINVGDSWKSVF